MPPTVRPVRRQGGQAPHREHRPPVPPSHRQGQEKQARGVWGKGQQHTD